MAKAEVSPAPTKKELDEWRELEEKRLKLQREIKGVEALQEKVEKKALAYAQANADSTRVVVCSRYRLELVLKRANVRWKDEYVRVQGLDAAEKIIAEQDTYETVKIHAPA